MKNVSITAMNEELRARVAAECPIFSEKAFNIFNLDDLRQLPTTGLKPPMVGVAYEGGAPSDQNSNIAARSAAKAAMFAVRFSVMIATEYKVASQNSQTRTDAMDLLDQVRVALLGYHGVNSRPWRLVSEEPMDSDLDGVIFYGQLWETDVPQIGNFKSP